MIQDTFFIDKFICNVTEYILQNESSLHICLSRSTEEAHMYYAATRDKSQVSLDRTFLSSAAEVRPLSDNQLLRISEPE